MANRPYLGHHLAWLNALRRGWLVALTLLQLSVLLPNPASAEHWAPPQTVYHPATGHTLDRLFLDQWRAMPELLGLPVTEEFTAKTGLGQDPNEEHIVQYFENVALVYLPDEAPGEQVRTLDLGKGVLAGARQNPGAPKRFRGALKSGDCGDQGDGGCVAFAATRHTLRGDFKSYWEQVGGERLLGLPLTEEFAAAGGPTVQVFERAVLELRDGSVVPRPIGTQAAWRHRLDTEPVARPDGIPVYDEVLFVAPAEPEPEPEPEPVIEPEPVLEPEPVMSVADVGPGPQQGGDREIVVSISGQAMWAYEEGQLVNSGLVSTGTAEVPETTTPIGFFQIHTKYDIQTMEGTISNEYYRVDDVPNVMYFDDQGNALHGTYWHSNFGTPMSHGCVNLPLDVAAWMYAWAPIGTPVTVIA